MTTAVIIGVVVGILAGWFSCQRMYDRHLVAADKERGRLIDSLAKSDALVSMLSAENQQLKSKIERVHSEPDSFVG